MITADATTVLEALRTHPIVNNAMVLQHQIPQPVYTTVGDQLVLDSDAPYKNEEAILGYSVYRNSNALVERPCVVAHIDRSKVLRIIAVRQTVTMNDSIIEVLNDHFSEDDILDVGDHESLATLLVLTYLGKPTYNYKSAVFKQFLANNTDLLESWVPLLTTVPMLSKHTVKDTAECGRYSTLSVAIKLNPKLKSTHLF